GEPLEAAAHGSLQKYTVAASESPWIEPEWAHRLSTAPPEPFAVLRWYENATVAVPPTLKCRVIKYAPPKSPYAPAVQPLEQAWLETGGCLTEDAEAREARPVTPRFKPPVHRVLTARPLARPAPLRPRRSPPRCPRGAASPTAHPASRRAAPRPRARPTL